MLKGGYILGTKLDPRVKRTRAMFEKALLDLMDEKEYRSITVLEIAQRSTLNRATFYLHYYDKDHLLEQILDEALNDLKVSVEVKEVEYAYKSDHPHPIFIRLFEKMIEKHKFYQIMLVRETNYYFTEEVRKIIKNFVQEGTNYLRKENIKYYVPSDISIAYISSAYLGVIIWWLKNDMPYTPVYMASQLTRMSTVGPFVDNPFLNSD